MYGSADAARTVHMSVPRMNALMKQAGEKVNIKRHWVGAGDTKRAMYGPADIEGHQVSSATRAAMACAVTPAAVHATP